MGNTVLLSHLQALRSTIGYHYHSSAILSCQVGLKLPQMASWHEACFLFDILVQLIAFLNITPYFSETLLGGGSFFSSSLESTRAHVQEYEGRVWC